MSDAWFLEGASIGEGDQVANSLADRILTLQSNLTDTLAEATEVEEHLHNRTRWWGALAAPDETNAIEANVNRPFVALSGNNTWGTAIPILGTGDNPVLATDTYFDANQILVVDTDHATAYRVRFIWGTGTSADAITAGQWSEGMFITSTGPFSSGVPATGKMPRIPVGYKMWAQVWNATNASAVDFFWDAHGYPS